MLSRLTRASSLLRRHAPRILRGAGLGIGGGGIVALSTTGCTPLTSNYHPQGIDASEADILATRHFGRRGLHPPIEPYNTGYITQVTAKGTEHKIYFEESGNPKGQPVILVHGGPGGGCSEAYRTFHNAEHYRIVCFDQRGCGRSTPHASLDENDTWKLIEDMESIREHLGIDTWQLFGGSWGSTLALAYAIRHPSRVDSLVLRGIFTITRRELEWYYQEGASWIFPDRFDDFKAAIPIEEQHDLITAYRKRLIGDDPEEQIKAARAWTQWENTTSNLFPVGSDEVKGDGDNFALAFARIENHFFHNHGFFEWDTWLVDNVDKIRHIPTVIVHGRYDVVCPAKNAWELHKAFPEAEFHLIKDSGHAYTEPGNLDILMRATAKFIGVRAPHSRN